MIKDNLFRNEGYFSHPRTLEKWLGVTRSREKWKRVRKKEVTIINEKSIYLFARTEALNAKIPQVSYHRLQNAITLTPTIISKDKRLLTPEPTIFKCLNTKKLFYQERKHGYASLATIKKAADFRLALKYQKPPQPKRLHISQLIRKS